MKNKEKKELKVQKAKVRSNVFFACNSCHYQWNETDYLGGDEKFVSGEVCPECESIDTMAI